MLIEKIAIFIIFLGPLVFFHELGHYLFARLFGVRVEVFSIGFGPKLFKFKRGDTEYAISLIPLGGYVKMFGDDPLNKDAIPESERDKSFTFKGKWARFWIVMGGPLANFILAWVIFFSLLMVGERVPEIRLGVVPENSSFYAKGIRSGDILKKVNTKEIYSPSDIMLEGSSVVKTVAVLRGDKVEEIQVNQPGEQFFTEFMSYPPLLRKPIIVDAEGNRYALSFNQEKVDWDKSLDEMAYTQGGVDAYLFKITSNATEEGVVTEPTSSAKLDLNFSTRQQFIEALADNGYRTLDLQVKSINTKSAADKAGIVAGDVILELEGEHVFSFDELRERLQLIEKESVSLKIWHKGAMKDIALTPDKMVQDGKEVKLIGVYSSGEFLGLNFVQTESKGFGHSFMMAFSRTWETMVKTVEGFGKLLTGAVSVKNIGGPLAIGKVASDSFNTSLTYFFQLMALISIINLFPIPVLDGGHIMFIFLELINRGPVSRRKMEIAQQVGLSLLLMLMVGAIFNDFSRFF
jgi:regulator of sigma E protease